jgi:hypothetical protein
MRFTLSAVLLLSLLAGCSSKEPKIYPVRGEVFVNGWPAHEAIVLLVPISESYPAKYSGPFAQVGEDGSFAISTAGNSDGALEGEYAVLISWKERSGLLKDQFDGKDRLAGAYYDQTKPKFKVKIEAKPNQLQRFDLEAPHIKTKPTTTLPAGEGIRVTIP